MSDWLDWRGPEMEQLPHPVKVYCMWCGRETYARNMTCGRCSGHKETDWFSHDHG
jgi:hypothetical protein